MEKGEMSKDKNRSSMEIIIYLVTLIVTLWALKQLVIAFKNVIN